MNNTENSKLFIKNAIEATIKITILGTMVLSTILIIKPFIIPVIWGVIIAITMEPFISRLTTIMGGRRKFASTLFAIVAIAILVVPVSMLATTSFDMVQTIVENLENNSIVIPPPPPKIAEWPLIGPSINKTWSLAASNLGDTIEQFSPQLKIAALTAFGSIKGGAAAFFLFMISVVISAALLATAEQNSAFIKKVFNRFAGDKGAEISSLATATIRGVMMGVVGVAFIQAALAYLGMLVISIPGSAIWTIMVLICAVLQLPTLIVLGPVAGYVFSYHETTTAVIFLVWVLVVGVSDTFLKPLLMGRGVDIPMLVILIGALGGMMLFGIIGLFVGAVAVAMMYSLFIAWLDEKDSTD